MKRTIYGVHDNDNITFLTLEAAEDWVIENYPEYCMCKDWSIDFLERMIWEDVVETLCAA
jgi:hypothetical protein